MNRSNASEPPAADRLIALPEVMHLTGKGRTQVYAEVKAGRLAAPLKLGRASRWPESEVRAYVAELIRTAPRKGAA